MDTNTVSCDICCSFTFSYLGFAICHALHILDDKTSISTITLDF